MQPPGISWVARSDTPATPGCPSLPGGPSRPFSPLSPRGPWGPRGQLFFCSPQPARQLLRVTLTVNQCPLQTAALFRELTKINHFALMGKKLTAFACLSFLPSHKNSAKAVAVRNPATWLRMKLHNFRPRIVYDHLIIFVFLSSDSNKIFLSNHHLQNS